MPIANYARGAMLDALFNGTALQKTARYVKLHTGDPGVNGTANAATNATRQPLTSAASASALFTSVNDLIWTNVPATETYSHVSIWDASTAGNCLWYGPLTTPQAIAAGNTFTIPTGSLTVGLT